MIVFFQQNLYVGWGEVFYTASWILILHIMVFRCLMLQERWVDGVG